MFQIYVKTTHEKGRGVFALRDFFVGELIETCPIILLPKKDPACFGNDGKQITGWGNNSILDSYVFCWESVVGEKDFAICLGYGSLYNHSYEPNAIYEQNYTNNTIEIYAHKAIGKDQEIFLNYNKDPRCNDPVWFKF
jgi:SET domain-containing protein